MLQGWIVIAVALVYIGLLFLVASYGDRSARFEDPFGNEWAAMTHIKDVSEKEMKKAMAQMSAGAA